MKLGRDVLLLCLGHGERRGLAHLHAMLTLTTLTADAVEGMAAFLEKRSPRGWPEPVTDARAVSVTTGESDENEMSAQASADHRDHRTGRVVPGGAPA